MDEILFLLAVAVHRLGGEMRITEDETEAFDAADRKMKFDYEPDGDVVVTVEDNDLPDGASGRTTLTDGTVVTVLEAA